MRLLVLPRDANPYQEELYAEVRRRGGRVRYLGELTASRSLNLALLPLETVAMALLGWRLVHVHWLFGFGLPGSRRLPWLRRVGQRWFGLWLRVVRAARMDLVWTAHNVLPHAPVFHDDVAARRALVRASALVVAHSPHVVDELTALGARPRRAAVVPFGATARHAATATRPVATGVREILFFGQVLEYKGVEDLVEAARRVPARTGLRVRVAGRCPDPALRRRLEERAEAAGGRLVLDLRFVPDDELAVLVDAADAVALPFRRVTTSSTVALALAHGRPLVLPSLPAFAGLPADAVRWYDGTVEGLADALRALAEAPAETLDRMARAARDHAVPGWDEVADEMLTAIASATAAGGG
jgi:glycosyltransferase involved in cell wall biosynthesis